MDGLPSYYFCRWGTASAQRGCGWAHQKCSKAGKGRAPQRSSSVNLLTNVPDKCFNQIACKLVGSIELLVLLSDPHDFSSAEGGPENKFFEKRTVAVRIVKRSELALENPGLKRGMRHRVRVELCQVDTQVHSVNCIDVEQVLHWLSKPERQHVRLSGSFSE